MPEPKPSIFSDGPMTEVPLAEPPLVTVLAQVQFPSSPELVDPDNIADLRRCLRESYPILREDKTVGFLVTASGVTEAPQAERVMRLRNKAEDWQISLSQNFIALNTSSYTSRDDFCTRFEEVMAAVGGLAAPVVYDRLGIRYINRFTDVDIATLETLVAGPFLGLAALDLGSAEIVQSYTQTLLSYAEGDISARWGLLPPGMVVDPALPAVEAISWILDIDVFQERKGDFAADEIGREVRRYADIAYRFFRGAATDELLHRAGD